MTTITKQYRISNITEAMDKLNTEKADELVSKMAKVFGMSVAGFKRALTVKADNVLGVEAERILKEYLEAEKLPTKKQESEVSSGNVTISDFRMLLGATRELKPSKEKKSLLKILENDFPKAMGKSFYVITRCCGTRVELNEAATEVYVEAINIYSDIR